MPSILERPALVLNRSWQPVQVTSVQKALVLLARDAARVVDPESFQLYNWDDWAVRPASKDEPAIRGVMLRLRAPEIVSLSRYERTPDIRIAFSKRSVFRRDRLTCQYCGRQPGREELTLDHVLPKSKGGATSWENCVSACGACNRRKADRTPEQAGMRLRRSPSRPTWKPLSNHRGSLASWAPFLGAARAPLAMVS
ncbi:MAG: HNH endonuclease [Planctomycetes bacterium]|nr:HNH endonuclease [Planctomycetota bacterium]